MANKLGREEYNKDMLCGMMEEAYEGERLVNCGDVYILINEEDETLATLDKATGKFLFTEAGKLKSNKRQYIRLPIPGNPKYMCSNYAFRIIAEGLFGDSRQQERYMRFINSDCVPNHINGDTEDNRDINLEVDTKGMNNTHARLMEEVNFYHPELIESSLDCQGNTMHRWADGVGVSCKEIRRWNSANPKEPIKAFRDKKGQRRPHLTKEQVDRMLIFFGKQGGEL